MEAKLIQALRELITHEIDIIHESDWWQQLIDEAVIDGWLSERTTRLLRLVTRDTLF